MVLGRLVGEPEGCAGDFKLRDGGTAGKVSLFSRAKQNWRIIVAPPVKWFKTNSIEACLDEIRSLTERVADLGRSVDRWNTVMLWGLALAAMAAFAVGISTYLIVLRSRQQTDAQKLLSAAKDRKLQGDLAQKDKDIAGLNKDAEGLKNQNLVLSNKLAELRVQSQARRLTGKQKDELARLLKGTHGGLTIVSPMADGEASDFADDFNSAVHEEAGWDTLRIKNQITEKFGVAIVTAEGTAPLPTLDLLDRALSKIGIRHTIETVKNGDASTSPHFQAGYLYLVVEHKPLPKDSAQVPAQ